MAPETKVCEAHSGIAAEIDSLQKSDISQWTAIHRIEQRIPVWATLLISVLTFALGFVTSFAMFVKK